MHPKRKSVRPDIPFSLAAFIADCLQSPAHSWSIGIPGAIGEFMYDDDEAIDIQVDNVQLSVLTPRGGMRALITPAIKCVAYETLSPCTRSWSQHLAFCIPAEKARLEYRKTLTELGTDEHAISSARRQHRLFDLGLGSPWLHFCIRTGERKLVELLRRNCGQSIFAEGNPVPAAMLAASPTRVVLSALGRVEIDNPIPVTATPVGPHTHLLPAMLETKRPVNSALPAGYIEALTCFPEHPVFDKYGRQTSFNRSAYDNFQHLLCRFGAPEYCHEKNRISREMLLNSRDCTLIPGALPWQRQLFRIAGMQTAYLRRC